MEKLSDYSGDRFKFRIAKLSEIDRLNHISMASKRHWNYPEEWLLKWQDDLRIVADDLLTAMVMVLEEEGVVKGFCAIEERVDSYEVLHLWVLPESMGQGLGKALLQQSLKHAIQKDLPVLVEADPNAENFYKKQGFETYAKKESYPPGRFLPLMKLASFLKPVN